MDLYSELWNAKNERKWNFKIVTPPKKAAIYLTPTVHKALR